MREISCEMQWNGKIDGKFKIINSILQKTLSKFILKLVTIILIFQRNQLIYDGDILPEKCFTDEHINSDDPNNPAPDNEITINSVDHHSVR